MQHIYRYDDKKTRLCYCIGPGKCKDSQCPLVKEHNQMKKKIYILKNDNTIKDIP